MFTLQTQCFLIEQTSQQKLDVLPATVNRQFISRMQTVNKIKADTRAGKTSFTGTGNEGE